MSRHALIPVTDAADSRLARFRANERALANRSDRRNDAGAGEFLAEGDLVVERALDAGCEPVAALVDAERCPAVVDRLLTRIDVHTGDAMIRQHLTGLGSPQRIVALFRRPPRPAGTDLLASAHRLVVVEGVDNPANIGAIVRNAAALGWDGLILDHDSADPLARRALRVAMGTAFTLPHARVADLASLMRSAPPEMIRWALTPSPDAVDLDAIAVDPGRPAALLIGSERAGLSEALLETATARIRIPMAPGVDSLNVAAATAIACHRLRR